MSEIKIKEVELIKISVHPEDTLLFKITSDDLEESDFRGFSEQLQARFPNNKVMVTMLRPGNELEVFKVSPAKYSDPVPLPPPAQDCSVPTSYCNDCGCGKKERIEALNDSMKVPLPPETTENEYNIVESIDPLLQKLESGKSIEELIEEFDIKVKKLND